jgi:hypothetical protein
MKVDVCVCIQVCIQVRAKKGFKTCLHAIVEKFEKYLQINFRREKRQTAK